MGQLKGQTSEPIAVIGEAVTEVHQGQAIGGLLTFHGAGHVCWAAGRQMRLNCQADVLHG